VVVLGFYHQPVCIAMGVYGIVVVGKQVYVFFGRTAKQQQYGKPCRKNYMSRSFYQSILAAEN